MQHCGKCPDAVAQIRGGIDAPQLSGCVQFYQESGCVLVVAKISGLPMESETGFYGFHIHQGESCSGMEFSATGSHYDPSNQPHPKHAGDLPPLLACQGNAYLSVKTDRFSVSDKVTHMMHLCGQGTDTVGEFTERLIKAMYEINAKTDVSGALYFVRKGLKIVAVQIKGKAKDKVEMCNAGISVDAQRCALPKVTKADMRKAVVTSKAFRTAPGHLISVSDKHVRY